MFTATHKYILSICKNMAGIARKTLLMTATTSMLMLAMPAHSATVDIADIPLTLGGQIKPNITYLLDDSGSMHFEVMPEEYIKLSARYIYPRASSVYGGSDYTNIVPTVDDDPYNALSRSSDFNATYYNPEFVYEPWTKADGSQYADADPTNAFHNPENTGAGSRDLTTDNSQSAWWVECSAASSCNYSDSTNYVSKTFYPATYFEYNGGGEWDWNNYTKVEIKPGNAPFSRSATREDCVDHNACTYDEEMQNFANWYQFYRSRILTARAGSGAAFAQLADPTDPAAAVRVNFATLNKGSDSIDGETTDTLVNGVRPFIGTDREAFFDELYTRTIPSSGTPTRKALDDVGQYYSRGDSLGPWSETPGTSGGDDISCRHSYTIVMTDGYWSTGGSNDADTNDARDNNDGQDGSTITGPDGASYQYTAESPFEDNVSSTLADVAMYYWKRDLRTDLTNDVPTNYTDPAFWQHMVTFGASFGVTGTINEQDAFDAIGDNTVTISWPDPFATEEAKIDDLLHASVNGRGGFFSAQNPKEFADGLAATINNVSGRTSSSAAIAANSTRLDSGTFIYQAKFDSSEWSGTVEALKVNLDGSIAQTPDWSAADELPAHTNRNIITYDGTAGVKFDWNDISTTQQTALGSQGVLEYLRGDQSNEVKNGGSFRNRDSLLGDIVNSDPWFVGEANFGYGLLVGDEGDDYVDFIRNSSYTNRPNVVYIGANDGMLHGFDAETGEELLAYVPNAVYDNLPDLSSTSYNHKFYVDGSPRAGAAYIDLGSGKEWRTVLLGSTGAGGRSVFALDVTSPSTFSESDVLWEFTHSELGYSIGQPTIVRLNTGQWAAIFGNGYNSDSQKAGIFMVDIETGNLIKYFDTDAGDTNNPNGMATPLVIDLDNDRIADRIYAGDLLGNMWRFDIDNSNTNQWGSAFKQGNTPKPLFTAEGPSSEVQPITSKPQAKNHDGGGIMVYFGTGKYFEVGDNVVPSSNVPVNSFYGVLDEDAEVARANLLEQEIFYEDSNESFNNPQTNTNHEWGVRMITGREMTTQSGWYMDLVSPPPNSFGAQGERIVASPLLWAGRIIITSIIPNDDPCGWGGSTWLMELDPNSGSRLDYSVFDLNEDGNFDNKEFMTVKDPDSGKNVSIPVSGMQPKEGLAGGAPPPPICSSDFCIKLMSGSTSKAESIKNNPKNAGGSRLSWEQLK
ncbi:pilus assembly protein [Thiohalophilus sp.]|uniref:pilus assembly protein n=1 Tax=Thiohalophilus sp. TaxID=3028392 RepID=UPI002ACE2FCA|nr:PilC/PilY family type IV pilus protein [Thiohalophilus sp.]MDZ7803058.1 PilC/PilY family type IV pilus protein [Thiohalophilus sp.]